MKTPQLPQGTQRGHLRLLWVYNRRGPEWMELWVDPNDISAIQELPGAGPTIDEQVCALVLRSSSDRYIVANPPQAILEILGLKEPPP